MGTSGPWAESGDRGAAQNLLRRLGGATLSTTSSVSLTHINTPHGSGEVPANLS